MDHRDTGHIPHFFLCAPGSGLGLTDVTIVKLNNSNPPSGSHNRNMRPPGSTETCSPWGTDTARPSARWITNGLDWLTYLRKAFSVIIAHSCSQQGARCGLGARHFRFPVRTAINPTVLEARSGRLSRLVVDEPLELSAGWRPRREASGTLGPGLPGKWRSGDASKATSHRDRFRPTESPVPSAFASAVTASGAEDDAMAGLGPEGAGELAYGHPRAHVPT